MHLFFWEIISSRIIIAVKNSITKKFREIILFIKHMTLLKYITLISILML